MPAAGTNVPVPVSGSTMVSASRSDAARFQARTTLVLGAASSTGRSRGGTGCCSATARQGRVRGSGASSASGSQRTQACQVCRGARVRSNAIAPSAYVGTTGVFATRTTRATLNGPLA